MDNKDITSDDWREAIARMKNRNRRPADSPEEMERRIRRAELYLAESGRLVMENDARLRFLERARVLRHDSPHNTHARLRLHLAIYCEAAAQEYISEERAEKIRKLIEQCETKLELGCEHTVVVCHDTYLYGTLRWETGGHRVCAHCGLSEVWKQEFEKLDQAENRTFLYYPDPDEDPDE